MQEREVVSPLNMLLEMQRALPLEGSSLSNLIPNAIKQ